MIWKIAGIVLIVLGALVLGFTLTAGAPEDVAAAGGVAQLLAYGIQLTIVGVGCVLSGLLCIVVAKLR